jgi:hypothetical protein
MSECRGATDDSAIGHAIRKALRRLCHVAVHGMSCLHYGDSITGDKCCAVSRVVAQVGRDTCRLWPHAARRVLSVRGHFISSHDTASGASCAVGARRCHTDKRSGSVRHNASTLPKISERLARGSREAHGEAHGERERVTASVTLGLSVLPISSDSVYLVRYA